MFKQKKSEDRISPYLFHPVVIMFLVLLIAGTLFILSCCTPRDNIQEISEVKVYFGITKNHPNDCNCNDPVIRKIRKTAQVAEAASLALNELLIGPTKEERTKGYEFGPWIDKVMVRGVKIENKVAYADFSKEFYSYGGGSCRVEAIRTAIGNTLKQFPGVEKVAILVEGKEASIEP